MYISEDQTDWDEYLPFVMHAYRTSVHASTGVTPFEAMYGVPCRDPNDLTDPNMLPEIPRHPRQYVTELAKRISDIQAKVRQNLMRAAQAREVAMNKGQHAHQYHTGDMVYLYKLTPRTKKKGSGEDEGEAAPAGRRSAKLAPHWQGPYRVRQITTPSNFQLESVTGKTVKGLVHVSRLKPFYGPSGDPEPRQNLQPPSLPETAVVEMDGQALYDERERQLAEDTREQQKAEKKRQKHQDKEPADLVRRISARPRKPSTLLQSGNYLTQPQWQKATVPSTAPKPHSSRGKRYEVEDITGQRLRDGRMQYRIRWTGYDEESWEDEDNLDTRNTGEALTRFHLNHGFVCRTCGKTAKTRAALRTHFKTHPQGLDARDRMPRVGEEGGKH
jgi:hypothetical protein